MPDPSDILQPPPHSFFIRIYYEDTDSGEIVYYANYLKFAERARTEMLRDYGVPHERLRREQGLAFVVKRCTAEYHRAARLDDLVEVRTEITRLGGASLDLNQRVLLDDQILVTLDVILALVDQRMRPARLPGSLIATLQQQSAARC